MDSLSAVERVRRELGALADPVRAGEMARYMRHRQEFLGVPSPLVIRIARGVAKDFRPREGALAGKAPRSSGKTPRPAAAGDRAAEKPEHPVHGEGVLRELWQGRWREERYAAFHLAERWQVWRWERALRLFEWMIRQGQWWDLVDPVATRLVGPLLLECPDRRVEAFGWIDAEGLWLRRAALLAQLKFKGATDRQALEAMILKTAPEGEFFIRKAIGWALREFGKTDPDWVRAFVATHEARLSPLSRREALKNLM